MEVDARRRLVDADEPGSQSLGQFERGAEVVGEHRGHQAVWDLGVDLRRLFNAIGFDPGSDGTKNLVTPKPGLWGAASHKCRPDEVAIALDRGTARHDPAAR